ncbi:MAG TPA: hypothetical protein VK179_06835 [Bacteroidales bacterium]|nr:hypothetical protein [Bacteroidales bacterium]
MATPVKNTPILEGQDAERFFCKLAQRIDKANSQEGKKEREIEMKRLEKNFNTIRSLSRDSF